MLELYHNDMSVCAQKVRLVLAEKAIEATLHHLNLRKGDQLTSDYLKLNPNGVVPTLVHDGRAVIESTIIAEYLDEAFPAVSMRPADLVDRAAMRIFASIPDQGLHAACGTVSTVVAFRHQYLALSPEELKRNIEETPDPARRERKRATIEKGLDASFVPDALRTYDSALKRMEARLGHGKPWLMGEQYTLADVAMTPYVTRLAHLHFDGMWAKRPQLAAWYERVQSRPNYKAIRDFVNPGYVALFDQHGPASWAKARTMLGV
ncbi:MAG: glutathione S-transferase family protein [Rhodospirillaceae bacterium]|nr:glutathione S-transferase family protein [Rhodospirillaceae bacterium]